MLDSLLFDSNVEDAVRRQSLYDGQIFVFSPRSSTVALCEHAQRFIEKAFSGVDPRTAQYNMPVESFVSICAPLKPRFIHDPKTIHLVRRVVAEFGCDVNDTYVDVPRLRMVTHGGYLTSGVGYAHHPHRDTWYSAPMCQLNWWLPIYGFDRQSSMAFHIRYWDEAVRNGSARFDYGEWNANGRKNAAQHITTDTRVQPKPEEELDLQPQIRIVCPPGGVILFSAAQLHSTVANTSGFTRFSVDFRTLSLSDVTARRGAPNVDSLPSGTSLGDFRRAADLQAMPSDVVQAYEKSPNAQSEIIAERVNS